MKYLSLFLSHTLIIISFLSPSTLPFFFFAPLVDKGGQLAPFIVGTFNSRAV